jgi:hypothetical protein
VTISCSALIVSARTSTLLRFDRYLPDNSTPVSFTLFSVAETILTSTGGELTAEIKKITEIIAMAKNE